MGFNPSSYHHVFALTGSSGSGKSSAATILRDFGAYIISADELSKAAVQKGSQALSEIVKEFGDKCLLPSGDLDRTFIRNIIFADAEKRKKVESIIHPKVRDLALKKFQEAVELKKNPIIYDVPLYFEAGLDKLNFKGCILVYASDEDCVQRIMTRDNLSREDAERRIKNQMSSEEKMEGATFVLNNSGTIEDLRLAISYLWEELK